MGAWGMSLDQAVSLTEAQINRLLPAYIERKKFEAKVTLAMLGQALKPKEDGAISLAALAMDFDIEGL